MVQHPCLWKQPLPLVRSILLVLHHAYLPGRAGTPVPVQVIHVRLQPQRP